MVWDTPEWCRRRCSLGSPGRCICRSWEEAYDSLHYHLGHREQDVHDCVDDHVDWPTLPVHAHLLGEWEIDGLPGVCKGPDIP